MVGDIGDADELNDAELRNCPAPSGVFSIFSVQNAGQGQDCPLRVGGRHQSLLSSCFSPFARIPEDVLLPWLSSASFSVMSFDRVDLLVG